MTALNKQALREAAQEEIMFRSVSDTSDAWQDEASPEAVLALLNELEAAEKRIAELESRTVTFKLPFTPEPSAFAPWAAKAFYQFHKDTVKSCVAVFSDACAAAGIRVEAE